MNQPKLTSTQASLVLWLAGRPHRRVVFGYHVGWRLHSDDPDDTLPRFHPTTMRALLNKCVLVVASVHGDLFNSVKHFALNPDLNPEDYQ